MKHVFFFTQETSVREGGGGVRKNDPATYIRNYTLLRLTCVELIEI
jgi:hypothetical protein